LKRLHQETKPKQNKKLPESVDITAIPPASLPSHPDTGFLSTFSEPDISSEATYSNKQQRYSQNHNFLGALA